MNTERLAPKFLICSSWALPIYVRDSNTPPDNRKVNNQDRKPGAVTADRHNMNSSDWDLITESGSGDGHKSLSMKARK